MRGRQLRAVECLINWISLLTSEEKLYTCTCTLENSVASSSSLRDECKSSELKYYYSIDTHDEYDITRSKTRVLNRSLSWSARQSIWSLLIKALVLMSNQHHDFDFIFKDIWICDLREKKCNGIVRILLLSTSRNPRMGFHFDYLIIVYEKTLSKVAE